MALLLPVALVEPLDELELDVLVLLPVDALGESSSSPPPQAARNAAALAVVAVATIARRRPIRRCRTLFQ